MISNATPATFVISNAQVWGTSEEVIGTSTLLWDADSFTWGTSSEVWGTSVLFWNDLSGLVNYLIIGVPDLVAFRSLVGTDVTLRVLNSDLGNTGVRYWQGQGIQGNFTFLDNSSSPGTDFEVSGIGVNADTDYKYKASFVINGIINGDAVEVVGIRSASVYVIATSNTV